MALTCGVMTWSSKNIGSLLSGQSDRNGPGSRNLVGSTFLLSCLSG